MKIVLKVMLALSLLMAVGNVVLLLRWFQAAPPDVEAFSARGAVFILVGFMLTTILALVFAFSAPRAGTEKPHPLKSLRHVLLALLLAPFAVAVSVVIMLALWALTPAPLDVDTGGARGVVFGVVGCGVAAILAIVFGYCLHRWRGGKILAGIAGATAFAWLWLVWDEPLHAPAEGSLLAAPGALELESDAIFRRYASIGRAGSAPAFAPPRLPTAVAPNLTGEWRVFVVGNGAFIRAEWERGRVAREWIAQLEAFSVIGDSYDGTTKSRRDGRTMLHATVQLHCAYASLLATEGRGDEALAVVRPALSVARKLQPGARSRARLIPARAAQRTLQRTIDFILHSAPISSPALQALGVTLQTAEDFTASWRRVFRSDAADFLPSIVLANPDDPLLTRVTANIFRPFVAPRASANLVSAQFERLLVVAAEGRGEGLRAHEVALQRELLVPTFKNALGRFVLARDSEQSFGFAFVREGWRVEDERRALLAKVEAKLSAVEPPATIPLSAPVKGAP